MPFKNYPAFAITVILTWLLTQSCSPNGNKEAGVGAVNGGTAADCGATLALQQAASGDSGSFAFNLSGNTDPCSVDGYVVGAQDSSKVVQRGDGSFVIDDVGAGEQDFIITGQTGAASGRGTTESTNISGANLDEPPLTGTLVGLRINSLTVEAGLTSERDLRLSPVGVISGVAKLSGQTNHIGIDVYIPGTRYLAKTDASGAYRLDDVPPGTHNLRFEYPGYGNGAVEGVALLSAGKTDAPDVVLVTGSGEGKIHLLDDAGRAMTADIPVLTSRVVNFSLQVAGQPRLMKVAEDGDFANLEWQPFRSNGTYIFKNNLEMGGRVTRKLSVKTLDGSTEGELAKALVIDLFAESRGKTVMTVSAVDGAGEPSLKITAKIKAPKNAVEMRYGLRSDFVGSNWLPVASTAEVKVDAEGPYSFFLQFRDADLIMSDLYSQPVVVDLFPAGSVSFGLVKSTLMVSEAPTVVLNDVQTPIQGDNVKLLVADNASFLAASSYDFASSVSYSLGAKSHACGTRKIYMTAVFTDPETAKEYISDQVAAAEVTYDCVRNFPSFFGEAGAGAATAYGNGKLFSWSGAVDGDIVEYGYVLDVGVAPNVGTGTWTPVSSVNAPVGRQFASAWSWSGKFVVYGGDPSPSGADWGGGIYDPGSNTWTKIDPPSPIYVNDDCDELNEQLETRPYLVGDFIVVWGNQSDGTFYCGESVGYTYDLNNATWSTMPRAPADPATPEVRCDHDSFDDGQPTSVVVGAKLFAYSGLQCDDSTSKINDSWIYDPATNLWFEVSLAGAPGFRFDYIRVADGNKVYIWGGRDLDGDDDPTLAGMNSGAIYNFVDNTWEPMGAGGDYIGLPPYDAEVGLPTPVAGMIDGKLVIWSGYQNTSKRWQGLVYDHLATTTKWKTMSLAGAPRYVSKVVEDEGANFRFYGDGAMISGDRLYVWSRATSSAELTDLDANLFSSYKVSTNTWTELPTAYGQTKDLIESPFYRNYVKTFGTDHGVLFFGGRTPRDVPEADKILGSGVLYYSN